MGRDEPNLMNRGVAVPWDDKCLSKEEANWMFTKMNDAIASELRTLRQKVEEMTEGIIKATVVNAQVIERLGKGDARMNDIEAALEKHLEESRDCQRLNLETRLRAEAKFQKLEETAEARQKMADEANRQILARLDKIDAKMEAAQRIADKAEGATWLARKLPDIAKVAAGLGLGGAIMKYLFGDAPK